MFRKLLPFVGIAVLVVGLTACSDNQDVGAGLKTDLDDAINELSTTSTPKGETTVPPVPDVGNTTAPPSTAAATTAPPSTQATTIPPDRKVEVSINGDTSGKSQFDPTNIQARVGTPVIFTNRDTQMRFVVSPSGNFRSPDLAPGASWTYRPNKVGTFELKDGTRPYVNGQLQVY